MTDEQKIWDRIRAAQKRHTKISLEQEQARKRFYFPIAVGLVYTLFERLSSMGDNPYTDDVLILWRNTEIHVTLAISGQSDGWFSELFTPPALLLDALYKAKRNE